MNDRTKRPNVGMPSVSQIREALDDSGYLFEHEVASLLDGLGFHVETSWAFSDPDEGKSREIDIRAFRTTHRDTMSSVNVAIQLLIECKDSGAPLVFLQRDKNARELAHAQPAEYHFPLKNYNVHINANSYTEVPAFDFLSLAKDHYYYRQATKATQFARIVRKGSNWHANHDGVYDALILPLAKAAAFELGGLKRHDGQPAKPVYIRLIFPIVVVRSHLYAYDLSSAAATIEPAPMVSFLRHIESGTLTGYHLTDFVTLDDLGRYITEDVGGFAAAVAARFKDNREKLLTRIQTTRLR